MPVLDPEVQRRYREVGRERMRAWRAKRKGKLALVRRALADGSLPAELLDVDNVPMPTQEEIEAARERNLERAKRRVGRRRAKLLEATTARDEGQQGPG